MGMPKARVLPEPVSALPHTSRPARASGSVAAWMGKGSVIPARASTCTRSGATPSIAKVGVVEIVCGPTVLVGRALGMVKKKLHSSTDYERVAIKVTPLEPDERSANKVNHCGARWYAVSLWHNHTIRSAEPVGYFFFGPLFSMGGFAAPFFFVLPPFLDIRPLFSHSGSFSQYNRSRFC